MNFELKQQEEMKIIQKRIDTLRNVKLFITDIKDDFLTKSFFERKDISKCEPTSPLGRSFLTSNF
mgnify:CR=1 FL=1